ncbi:MAG: hypothetical protein ABSG03_39840 [Bryobacteraceae bacterium]
MTDNLLAQCDLFKAGIAESGAPNRTLTPFGFQNERRTMAPEQVSGQPSSGTDIYAFGVIAYEMLTGRKPFVPENAAQLAELQRAGVRVKPSALRPAISSDAEKLILQSLVIPLGYCPVYSAISPAIPPARAGSQEIWARQIWVHRQASSQAPPSVPVPEREEIAGTAAPFAPRPGLPGFRGGSPGRRDR